LCLSWVIACVLCTTYRMFTPFCPHGSTCRRTRSEPFLPLNLEHQKHTIPGFPTVLRATTRSLSGYYEDSEGSLRLVQPQLSAGSAGRLINACKSPGSTVPLQRNLCAWCLLSPEPTANSQEPTARALWDAGTAVASLELALSGAAVTALGEAFASPLFAKGIPGPSPWLFNPTRLVGLVVRIGGLAALGLSKPPRVATNPLLGPQST
jgi:hypothetical protein